MKQIILRSDYGPLGKTADRCLVRLALTWAAFGGLAALRWRAMPDGPLGGAAAWAIALLGGLALAARTTQV